MVTIQEALAAATAASVAGAGEKERREKDAEARAQQAIHDLLAEQQKTNEKLDQLIELMKHRG